MVDKDRIVPTKEQVEREITRITPLVHETLERVKQAAQASGRAPADVEIIAVTKYHPIETILAAERIGLTQLAENRVQALADRSQWTDTAQWHLIGSLQRNKVKLIPETLKAFHALDSMRLAEAISKQREASGKPLACFAQVNVTGERSKRGFAVEEAEAIWGKLKAVKHLELVGLMTMAERDATTKRWRETFDLLRRLAERLEPDRPLKLSMGMSQDYETAIRAGSTHVRLGTALFGPPLEPKP